MLFPQKIKVVANARHLNPHHEIVVVQNDTAVEFLVAVIGDNGQTSLPSETSYVLTSLHVRKRPTQKLGVMQEDGNILFDLDQAELGKTGTVQAYIQAYHPEKGRVTSHPFTYHVAPDPIYGAEIRPPDKSLIEQVIGEGPAIIAEAKAETELSITERTRLTGEVDGALLEMSQSKDAADQSAQVAQQAADNADDERERLTLDVSDKLNEVETARSATVQATGEATDAAGLARDEADAARLQKEEVQQILGAGPVASVNGETGVVTGLATQESMNQVTAQLADMTYQVGGFPGDTDDERIVNAFNFMNSLTKEGATLSFPGRTERYVMTSDVVSNGRWNLKMDQRVMYGGTGTAITINNAQTRTIEIMLSKSNNNWFTGADKSSVGVRFNNVNWSNIHIKDVRGFHTNVLFYNEVGKGSCYNNVFIGLLYDAFISIYLKQDVVDGVTKNWNNQNQFFGGAVKISGSFTPVMPGTCLVKNEGNNNIFVGTALEGNNFQYSFYTTATHNMYINCRFEANLDNSLAFKGANCYFNTIVGGYGLNDRITDTENPDNVTIIGGGRFKGYNANSSHSVFGATAVGSGNHPLIELSKALPDKSIKTVFSSNGDGKSSWYDPVIGLHPTVEIDGRYGQIKLGRGHEASEVSLIVDTNPTSKLIKLENWNYEFSETSSVSFKPITLPSETARIDLTKGNVFKTINTVPTTINSTTGGRDGRPVYLVCGDENTTISNSSLIKLKNGVSRKMLNGEVIHFLRIGGVLAET